MAAVIAENDESPWEDQTGRLYHFPARYLPILTPGQRVIYYKGRMRDRRFAGHRLSPDPHYFGVATIGRVFPDMNSRKGDNFADIENYNSFRSPVALRDSEGRTFELVPLSRRRNYWRDGVRPISDEIYDRILRVAGVTPRPTMRVRTPEEDELTSGLEGRRRVVYTTVYERDPRLRARALELHGTTCFGCNLNFEDQYGERGRGFIHIHHLQPLHGYNSETQVNPRTDLIPLCPNCHCITHRDKNHTLTLSELREIIRYRYSDGRRAG
jgi:putative restriction endonuclease